MDKFDVEIAVVKRDFILGEDAFQGFSTEDMEDIILENIEFMRRGDAEENQLYKQPIGYAIIVNKEKGLIYVYQRASDGNYNEKRLSGKSSIGIGGHIEKVDHSDDPIKDGLIREIEEEVSMNGSIKDVSVLGYINDDSNDVGKVHIGILYAVVTDSTEVGPNDAESIHGELISYDELVAKKDNLESWSQIALEPLKELLE